MDLERLGVGCSECLAGSLVVPKLSHLRKDSVRSLATGPLIWVLGARLDAKGSNRPVVRHQDPQDLGRAVVLDRPRSCFGSPPDHSFSCLTDLQLSVRQVRCLREHMVDEGDTLPRRKDDRIGE